MFTDVDSALHTPAGRSGILDAIVETTAQTGLYVAMVSALILSGPGEGHCGRASQPPPVL